MARQLIIELVGEATKFQKSLDEATGSASKFQTGIGGIASKVGGALAGIGIGAFLKESVTQANESAQAQAALSTAIQNSGALAGVAASDFDSFNKAMSKKTLADDDAIASGEAVIANLGLTKAQIEAGVPAMLDYAAKTGTDLPTAADALEKAALGNTKALKSLGIEGFKPTGDKAKDFATVSELVEAKVKGASQAQLDAAGPGAKLKKSMDELQESVGTLLLPALNALAGIGAKITDWLTNSSAPTKIFIGVVGGLAVAVLGLNAAQTAWTAITGAITVAQAALNAVMALNPIVLVVAAVALLIGGMYELYQHFGPVHDAIDGMWQILQTAFHWAVDNWPLLLGILIGPIGLAVGVIVTHWDTIKDGFTKVKDWISDRIGDIVGFFTDIPGKIGGAISSVWDTVKNGATGAKTWVSDRIGDIVGFFTGIPGKLGSALAGIAGVITAPFRLEFDAVAGLWNNTLGAVSFHVPDWVPGLGGKGFSFPQMPHLAEGGVVSSPTVALIGEAGPEAVVPLSRLGSMGGRGGVTVSVGQIVVQGSDDPQATARAIRAEILRMTRSNVGAGLK